MKEQQIRTILNHAQIYASRNLWRNLRISKCENEAGH